MPSSKDKIEKVPCNSCLQETNHRNRYEIVRKGAEEIKHDFEIEWANTYTLFECCGCDEVTLRLETWHSEMDDFGESKPIFYPPRVGRQMPHWIRKVSSDIRELFDEVYAALHADSRRIAMMGARSVMDMVMLETLEGDKGNFPEKLKALEEAGYLGSNNRIVLYTALEVGSASSHRGHKPSVQDANVTMDIIENVIQAIVLEEDADDLRKATPKRN